MKDLAIEIWNKVIDGYEGRSQYRWPDLVKDLETIKPEAVDEDIEGIEQGFDGYMHGDD